MMIQYNYSPESPVNGCDMDWKINFYSKYNDMEILDQVNYDIWIVDENDNKIHSYAESIGKEKLFNAFGQVEHLLPVEQSGLVRYAIFVHGLGPEEQVDEEFGGYVIIEILVENNPLLKEITNGTNMSIPEWIKNNAKWWVDSTIDDAAFVGGIQFLIKEGIIQIPETTQSTTSSQEIPSWIKNNADWWYQGLISDDDFLKGIKFMVENGIITI
jgi:hypothetical protein